MVNRFNVEFLEEAYSFLKSLDEKSRNKVIYNISKVRLINDPELFKKITDDIWEFRTQSKGNQIRFLAFWDKTLKNPKVVICTHGFLKKQWKVSKQEIENAVNIMKHYYSLQPPVNL